MVLWNPVSQVIFHPAAAGYVFTLIQTAQMSSGALYRNNSIASRSANSDTYLAHLLLAEVASGSQESFRGSAMAE